MKLGRQSLMEFPLLTNLIAILVGYAAANFTNPFFWIAALFLFIPSNWIGRFTLASILAVGYALMSWPARTSFAEEVGFSPTPFSIALASSALAFFYVSIFASLVRFVLKNIGYVFQSESPQPESQAANRPSGKTAKKRLQKLPKAVRLALFLAVSWVACVPSYVFLFQPYGGYMRDDDMFHMFGVIVIPVIVGLGLFSIYRKFIR